MSLVSFASKTTTVFSTKSTATWPPSQMGLDTQSSFNLNHPMNARAPNWDAYRLPLARMEELRSQSTHWRITCSFPSSGVDYRDDVRAEFAKFDLSTYQGKEECKEVEYINVRGNNCRDCTAEWWQNRGKFLVHVSSVESCQLGRYRQYLNPDHRCTSDDSVTTNYWFGGRI